MDRIRGADGRELLVRVIGPGLALCAVVLGMGLILTGPLATTLRAEDGIVQALASHRTSTWNSITFYWSHIGNIEWVIAVCLAGAGLLLWWTRDWRLAAVPCLAVLLQFVIFDTVSTLVARARPPVKELALAPPTASYPSGHVSATSALYVTFAMLAAARLQPGWLRRLVVVVAVAIPLLVGFARLYEGMHHVTDVAAGLLNGITCALLALNWYRHSSGPADAQGTSRVF
ncbi:MAG TPA: phosphatase PAP2 family protein [Microlunatus sp.]|nr:phosphatase PAP2 family protein [Microlunatus sp.]